MSTATEASRGRWAEAWPDALAFLGGLALAWFNDWQTKDLVWSLWLSSLVIGYAMIVWTIFGPTQGNPILVTGGLFLLGFFTIHFGGFHFVHSVFLNAFFPVTDANRFPGAVLYWEVFRSYWVFVLFAAIAERGAFKRPVPVEPDTEVTVEAIERRKSRKAGGDGMMAPYKNVMRLHLLIFFFAFASFTKLDNFLVYAVVSAVYFFPWRLLKRERPAIAA